MHKAYQRINNWRDFLEKHPDLIEVSIDATEQQCYRSSDYRVCQMFCVNDDIYGY